MSQLPQLVMFDLDKTLARSKQPLTAEMATLVASLLVHTRVAVISGGALPQFLSQVVTQLPASTNLANLYLLPTSGAALYEWKEGAWSKVYEEHIEEVEAKRIEESIRASCAETGLIDLASSSYGERIEYRGAQVTLSALGQRAPVEEKEAWDPDGSKKEALRRAIAAKLPEYDVKVGGSTSIDVTKHGINKAYGVRKISEHLHIPIAKMLYIGDALFPGGNDEVVKGSGIATRQVADPAETIQVIGALLGE